MNDKINKFIITRITSYINDKTLFLENELKAEIERFVTNDIFINPDGLMSAKAKAMVYGFIDKTKDSILMASPYRSMFDTCLNNVVTGAWSTFYSNLNSDERNRMKQLNDALGPDFPLKSTNTRIVFMRFIRIGRDDTLQDSVLEMKSCELSNACVGCCLQ